jgi:hypothetical protein
LPAFLTYFVVQVRQPAALQEGDLEQDSQKRSGFYQGCYALNWQVRDLMNKNVGKFYTATDLRLCTNMVMKSELTLGS